MLILGEGGGVGRRSAGLHWPVSNKNIEIIERINLPNGRQADNTAEQLNENKVKRAFDMQTNSGNSVYVYS